MELVVISWGLIEFFVRVNYLGWQEYWHDHWNRLDISILLIVIGVNISNLLNPSVSDTMGLYILRLVRLGWILGQFCYGDTQSKFKSFIRTHFVQHIERAQVGGLFSLSPQTPMLSSGMCFALCWFYLMKTVLLMDLNKHAFSDFVSSP